MKNPKDIYPLKLDSCHGVLFPVEGQLIVVVDDPDKAWRKAILKQINDYGNQTATITEKGVLVKGSALGILL